MNLLITIILALIIIEIVIPVIAVGIGLIFCGFMVLIEKVLNCCR